MDEMVEIRREDLELMRAERERDIAEIKMLRGMLKMLEAEILEAVFDDG